MQVFPTDPSPTTNNLILIGSDIMKNNYHSYEMNLEIKCKLFKETPIEM